MVENFNCKISFQTNKKGFFTLLFKIALLSLVINLLICIVTLCELTLKGAFRGQVMWSHYLFNVAKFGIKNNVKMIRIISVEMNSNHPYDYTKVQYCKVTRNGYTTKKDLFATINRKFVTLPSEKIKQFLDIFLLTIIMGSLDATKKALAIKLDLRILVLTMFRISKICIDIVNADAMGFISKTCGKQEFEKAIKTVLGGEIYFPDRLSYSKA